MVTGATLFLCVLFVALSQVSKTNAVWRGRFLTTRVVKYRQESYCSNLILWWCAAYRQRPKPEISYDQNCVPGWRHNGDQNCNIPICSPECQHGGKCVAPDECQCTAGHTGRYTACTTAVCSHLLPCYPGKCIYPDSCDCDIGFNGIGQDACLTMTPDKGMPEISLSTCTLSHVRRVDGTTKFAYITDGSTREKDTLWSNQKDFNYLKFELQSLYEPPSLSHRPLYVPYSGFGIVGGEVSVNISKIPRSGGPIRDVAFTKQYDCQGLSDTTPNKDIANCTIIDDQFTTNIEHGDWLHVVFTAKSGGYRELVDTDQMQNIWRTQTYNGQINRKEVELKFDFEAPLHCSESSNSTNCSSIDTPLKIENEFTKLPINITWAGWTDDLSKMERYHLEVFKLSPDQNGNLEEKSPLNPVHYTDFIHTHDNIYHHSYTPNEDGMYSVLLQAADKANNSKIVRRLVLYSPTSNISLNEKDDGKIFVSTAVRETGYMWQTAKAGSKTEITVEWANHFINKFIEDGKLLNKVKSYPIQFQDIQRDGILRILKFVNQSFDDDEGARTTSETPNRHGIIRFEVVTSYSDDTDVPSHGWRDIDNLAEKFSFNVTLGDGRTARIWVRAHDVLGNTIVNGTEVHFDTTGPIVKNGSVDLVRNQVNGTYNYTSRVKFQAIDRDSGLHKIGFKLTRDDTSEVKYTGHVSGSSKNITGSCRSDADCNCVGEKCFLLDQTLDLDNCWFMTAKEELDYVNFTVDIIVYNQALLSEKFSLKIDKLDKLEGLEKYSGPTNIHVAQNLPNGVRLAWDLPETESCYGRTDIVIILNMDGGTSKVYTVSRATHFVDILGLNPENNYEAAFSLQYGNQRMGNVPFSFKTEASENLVPVEAVIGVVVVQRMNLIASSYTIPSVPTSLITVFMTILAILITVFTVLWKKGRLEPLRRRLSNMSLRYRENVRRTFRLRTRSESQSRFSDDLYVYGGMQIDERQDWYMNRDDITFENLLKAGHFANIYKATAYPNSNQQKTVVVKTLKEGFRDKDRELMIAKINFAAVKVEDNPYILKFIGAIIDADVLGPFIIYEYCEKGSLKDYLDSQMKHLTVELQEKLYRFGLDICKGMQYLASKEVVHRRLAARNVLLTATFAVKIAGFGPQEVESADDDAEAGKKERIPIKWMAPECMHSTVGATEKSDVWSYGVLLWEIFSLGETPYPSIRSRDLASKLKKGERLPKLENCDDMWNGIMSKAWNQNPQKRPTFEEIREELEKLFVESAGDYVYYCHKY